MQAGPQRIHTTAAAAIVFMIMTHLLDTPCFAHVVQSDGEDDDEVDDLGGGRNIQQHKRKGADG